MPDWGPDPIGTPTYGDWSQYVQFGAYGLLESLAGEARQYAHEDIAAEMVPLQRSARESREAQLEDMTPAGRKQFTSEIGSPEFWRSPTGWAVAQGLGVAPYMAASIIPVIATGGYGGLAMAAASSGILSDADLTSSMQEIVDTKTSKQLAQESQQYADDISKGVSEAEARQKLIDTMAGPGAHVAAITIGALSAGLGVERLTGGAASRILGRAAVGIPVAEGGFIKGGLRGAATGATSEFGEEAGQDVLRQMGEMAGGFREEYDPMSTLKSGLTGAIIGGPPGAAAGAVTRFGRGGKEEATTATPSTAPPPDPIVAATEPHAKGGGGVGGGSTAVTGTTATPPSPAGTTITPRTAEPTRTFPPSEPITRAPEGVPDVFKPVLRTPVSGATAPTTPGAIPEAFKAALAGEAIGAEAVTTPAPRPSLTPPGVQARLSGAIPLSSDLAPSPDVALALQSKTQASPAEKARQMVDQYGQTPPAAQQARQQAVDMVSQYQAKLPPVNREMRDTREPPPPAPPAPPRPNYAGPRPIYNRQNPLPDLRTVDQLPPEQQEQWREAYGRVGPKYGSANVLPSGILNEGEQAAYERELEEVETAAEIKGAKGKLRELKREAGERTGNISEEAKQKFIDDNIAAQAIFDTTVHDKTLHESVEETRERVETTLQRIRGAKVNIGKVYDVTPDYLVWAKEIQDMAEDFHRGKPSLARVEEFRLREAVLRAEGKAEFMRAARKADTATAKAKREQEQAEKDYETVEGEPGVGAIDRAASATGQKQRRGDETTSREAVKQSLYDEYEGIGPVLPGGKTIAGQKERAYRRPGRQLEGEELEEAAEEVEPPRTYRDRAGQLRNFFTGKLIKPPKLEKVYKKLKAKVRAGGKLTVRSSLGARAEMAKHKEAVAITEAERKTRKEEEQKNKRPTEAIGHEYMREVAVRMRRLIGGNVGKLITSANGTKFRITKFNIPKVTAEKRFFKTFEEFKAKLLHEPGTPLPEEFAPSVTVKNVETGENFTWTENDLMAALMSGEIVPSVRAARFIAPTETVIAPPAEFVGPKFPPAPEGYVRLFYKGVNPKKGGPKRWVTGSYERAANAARAGKVFYLDIPKDEPGLDATLRELEANGVANISADLAKFFSPAVALESKAGLPAKVKTGVGAEAGMTLAGRAEISSPVEARRRGREAAEAGLARESIPFSGYLGNQWLKGFAEVETVVKDAKLEEYIEEIITRPRKLFEQPKLAKPEVIKEKMEAWREVSERKRLGSPKQRLSRALVRVDKKATEAERAAGNARGGPLHLFGRELMIQYTKGMMRFGSRLAAHYGHIKGTKGADGNPIDMYIGPNIDADTVYVVDQMNPDGSFDEHKAMIGFDSQFEAQSMHAMTVGRERTGDVTPMSISQFKNWLKEDHSPKAPILPEVFEPVAERLAGVEASAIPITPVEPQERTGVIAEEFEEVIGVSDIRPQLEEWLNREGLDVAALPADARKAFPAFIKRLLDVVGDTIVVHMTPDEMSRFGDYGGFYDSEGNVIAVTQKTDHAVQMQNTLHEIAHAALMKATHNNPELQDIVNDIGREFSQALNAIAEPVGGTADFYRGFYAFVNAHEFVSEFVSNPSMRRRMAMTKTSPQLKKKLGVKKGIVKTLYDAMLNTAKRALGLTNTRANDTLFDAMFSTMQRVERSMEGRAPGALTDVEHDALVARGEVDRAMGAIWTAGRNAGTENLFPTRGPQDYTKSAIDLVTHYAKPRQTRAWALATRSMNQLAVRAKDSGIAFAKATRKVVNARERLGTRTREIQTSHDPFQERWAKAEKKHAGPEWDKFARYLLLETEAKARGDQTLDEQEHLKEEHINNVWSRAQHAKLAVAWPELHPDLQKLRTEFMNKTDSVQKQSAILMLNNLILKALKVKDPALAEKLYNKEELTEEESKKITPQLAAAIKGVMGLTNYKGPYYPEMRFGSHVVTGKYKYAEPADAVRIKDEDGLDVNNTFEYSGPDAMKRAMAFAAKQGPYARIKASWVDPATGETYFVDPDDGSLGEKITSKTPGAEARYRVTVQDKFTEFTNSLKEAQDLYAEMKKDPNFIGDEVAARAFNPNEDGGRELLAHDVRKLVDTLDKQPSYVDLPKHQKNAVKQALLELSLRMYGPTRVQSRRLPRRHVMGASLDWTQVQHQYIASMSGYLAKLENQPELDAGLDEMEEHITSDGNMKLVAERRAIFNEVEKRITNQEKVGPPSNWDIASNRIAALTFSNYLLSPAYSFNQMLQPLMVAAPVVAARHGWGATGREMKNVYAQTGIGKALKSGGMQTLKALKYEKGSNNYLDTIMDKVSPAQKEMLRYVQVNGGIAPNAGLEFDKVIGGDFTGTAADYLQNIARAMPAVIEVLNRTTTALFSYNLEMKKNGGNHQAAMEYALETVDATQGNYSRSNMPTFFNKNPAMRLMFQFKNYGQMMYWLIGNNIGRIMRNANEGDRKEASKALLNLAASHVTMAGVLGLPGLELVRLMLIPFGYSYDELENAERQLAANMFGEYAGELISRGLPRALGIDISERVGGANLLTFGQPRDDTEESFYAWAGKLAGGAAASMGMEFKKGADLVLQGDVAEGLEKMSPIKLLSDAMKSYRLITEGKKTESGLQVIDPIGPVDAFLTVLGYTPARHAEINESRRYLYAAQSNIAKERNELQRQWYQAGANDKYRLMGRIEAFNRNREEGEKLTVGDLNNYSKRKANEDVVDGFIVNRRNRELINSLDAYNR